MEGIQQDKIIEIITTLLPEEAQYTLFDYFKDLSRATEEVYTLVDVSRLALESLGMTEGASVPKTLFNTLGHIADLEEHLTAMAKEGEAE